MKVQKTNASTPDRGSRPKVRLTPLCEVRERLLSDPEVRVHYDELHIRDEIGRALAQARAKAGLTQEEVAALAHTTQSVVARLETGKGGVPSLQLLDRMARALGFVLALRLERREAA